MTEYKIQLGSFVETPRVPGTITEKNNQGQVVDLTPDHKYAKVRIRSQGRNRQDLPFKTSQLKRVTFPDTRPRKKTKEWDYSKEKKTGE